MTIDTKIHERLKEINCELQTLEQKIYTTAIRLDTALQNELKDAIDGLSDYDLKLEIQCYTDEEESEPICILRESLHGISTQDYHDFYVGDGINHNVRSQENNPMRGEFHCWLYHCLYDHTHLNWEQVATIKRFWVEIWTQRQYVEDCVD